MTEQLLEICATHGTWDMDYDPPLCDCDDIELMVIEDQTELPFYEDSDETPQ